MQYPFFAVLIGQEVWQKGGVETAVGRSGEGVAFTQQEVIPFERALRDHLFVVVKIGPKGVNQGHPGFPIFEGGCEVSNFQVVWRCRDAPLDPDEEFLRGAH